MKRVFLELKTVDGPTVFVRAEAVEAFEVVQSSARVEGHVKIYINGYKFLVCEDKDELVKKLQGE
jgi:uncharacterized protein YlzI (FlbEa/FlbD family)